MHITPVLLKNYSFHDFLNRSNFEFVCFFLKIKISPQKMFMSCFRLQHCAYLNDTSNVFAHLLIIFLRHDWFGFSQINEDALDSLCNDILAQITPLSSN